MVQDKLLLKLLKSPKFQRLTKQEQMIELQDYEYQKKKFKEQQLCPVQ